VSRQTRTVIGDFGYDNCAVTELSTQICIGLLSETTHRVHYSISFAAVRKSCRETCQRLPTACHSATRHRCYTAFENADRRVAAHT